MRDADLLECDAVVTAVGDGAVQLDRTVFYPQGGGQALEALDRPGWIST